MADQNSEAGCLWVFIVFIMLIIMLGFWKRDGYIEDLQRRVGTIETQLPK